MLLLDHYKQCQQQSSAFICQYFFPLADCSTGKSYKATKEDCLLISTGVCSDLWTLANTFGYGSVLPDCSTLPNGMKIILSITKNLYFVQLPMIHLLSQFPLKA